MPDTSINTASEPARRDPDTRFFGHPRGLATLFLTEMWERFSYYGMRALLILYMTADTVHGGLGFNVSKAAAIYGLYTAGVYLGGLPGGWIADQILGLRRAVLVGGVLIALGNYSLALPHISSFYMGLLLIVLGTGLLKPNVSAIVGQLYRSGDPRRDAGFSIFYMGINLGAFLAPLVCGYIGEKVDWHLGFGLAGIGMTLGLIQYWSGTRHLGNVGLKPADGPGRQAARRHVLTGAAACLAVALAAAFLSRRGFVEFTAQRISTGMGVFLIVAVLVLFGWLLFGGQWTAAERSRLVVVFVLFLSAALFWSIFEQAGSTLNLFAERNTNKMVLGYAFPASWFQSLNSLFIFAFAPVFAWLWVWLGRGNPSSPRKFVVGLLFAGLGFAVLAVAATRSASGALLSPAWLTVTYFLHTVGELCLSPVGLSAMTQLAPRRIAGMIMGVWFLSTAVGNYLGARFASFYEAMPLSRLFSWVTALAIAAAIILAIFVPRIERLMAEPASGVEPGGGDPIPATPASTPGRQLGV